MKQHFPLLLLIIFFTSCNGQTETQLQTVTINQSPLLPPGKSKVTKNHFRDEYREAAENIFWGLMDKNGNLWFCSQGEGVYRYDGMWFTNFTTSYGLSSNEVSCAFEDNAGNIWFGTAAGICRYSPATGLIAAIPIVVAIGSNPVPYGAAHNNPSANNGVNCIIQDKNGKLWFGTEEGVYCYDPSAEVMSGTKTFTRFLDDKSIINKDSITLKHTDCIFQDKNGNIWFTSGPLGQEGVTRYYGKTLTNFKPNSDGWVRHIIEDSKGNLLFITRHRGVCRFEPNTNSFVNISDKSGIDNWSLTSGMIDKEGNCWFGEERQEGENGYEGGLWKYDGTSFTKVSNKAPWCMVEDKAGNIWFGTRGNGLFRYDGKTITTFSE